MAASLMKIAYLRMCHAIYDPLDDLLGDEVSGCVNRDAPVLEFWVILNAEIRQHHIAVPDVVKLHGL